MITSSIQSHKLSLSRVLQTLYHYLTVLQEPLTRASLVSLQEMWYLGRCPPLKTGVEEKESPKKKRGGTSWPRRLGQSFGRSKWVSNQEIWYEKSFQKREKQLVQEWFFFFFFGQMIRERRVGFCLFLGVKIAILEASRFENSGSEGFARVEVSFFIVVAWITNLGSLTNGVPQNDTCKWETLALEGAQQVS